VPALAVGLCKADTKAGPAILLPLYFRGDGVLPDR